MGKDSAVSRAVHRLQAVRLLLNVKGEHVLSVVSPVARGLPQVRLINVGADDLVKSSLLVLAPDQLHQSIVDSSAVGQEEGGTRRNLVEEEQLLFQTDLSVVALRSLFKESLVLLKLLLVGE